MMLQCGWPATMYEWPSDEVVNEPKNDSCPSETPLTSIPRAACLNWAPQNGAVRVSPNRVETNNPSLVNRYHCPKLLFTATNLPSHPRKPQPPTMSPGSARGAPSPKPGHWFGYVHFDFVFG